VYIYNFVGIGCVYLRAIEYKKKSGGEEYASDK
jgi:hypothetical protein